MLSGDGLGTAVLSPVLSVSSPGSQSTIRGHVLVSPKHDCHTTAAARGLLSVPVELLNATGAMVDQVLTNNQGSYAFHGLSSGVYALQQHVPAGLVAASAHVGNGGGIALDARLIGEIVLTTGGLVSGYDFCDQPDAIGRQTGRDGHPVVAHAMQRVAEPVFIPPLKILPGPKSPALSAAWILPPRIVSAPPAYQRPPAVLAPPQSDPIFGGSSRRLTSEPASFDEVFGEIFAQLAKTRETIDDGQPAGILPGDYRLDFTATTDPIAEGASSEAVDHVFNISAANGDDQEPAPASAPLPLEPTWIGA